MGGGGSSPHGGTDSGEYKNLEISLDIIGLSQHGENIVELPKSSPFKIKLQKGSGVSKETGGLGNPGGSGGSGGSQGMMDKETMRQLMKEVMGETMKETESKIEKAS